MQELGTTVQQHLVLGYLAQGYQLSEALKTKSETKLSHIRFSLQLGNKIERQCDGMICLFCSGDDKLLYGSQRIPRKWIIGCNGPCLHVSVSLRSWWHVTWGKLQLAKLPCMDFDYSWLVTSERWDSFNQNATITLIFSPRISGKNIEICSTWYMS